MFATLFKVLIRFILSIANVILLPINNLLTSQFPQVSLIITSFNYFIDLSIGNFLAFFGSILPPITKGLILFYLTYLGLRFVLVLNVHLIIKVFTILKNIKVW